VLSPSRITGNAAALLAARINLGPEVGSRAPPANELCSDQTCFSGICERPVTPLFLRIDPTPYASNFHYRADEGTARVIPGSLEALCPAPNNSRLEMPTLLPFPGSQAIGFNSRHCLQVVEADKCISEWIRILHSFPQSSTSFLRPPLNYFVVS
jgi:hypothetical protein